MTDITPIKKAADTAGTPAWTTEDWDSLIAGEVARQAGAQGADPAEIAWLLAGALADHRRTLQEAEAALARWRAADVEARGPVRFGDTFVRVKPKTTRKIHDRAALLGWLEHTAERLGAHEDAAELIEKVWRLDAGNLRISTLRSLAERAWRHEHPDTTDEAAKKYVRTIIDTFIEEDRSGPPTLEELPLHKAPKYAATLEHGHRVGSFDNKPKEDK